MRRESRPCTPPHPSQEHTEVVGGGIQLAVEAAACVRICVPGAFTGCSK